MRQSLLFSKTRKESPKDEVSRNASLLIRAGFIHKEMAGVYSYLPLGLRVLNKIIEIIREEMNAIGGQEVLLSSLQKPELWEKSGRWSDNVMDVWFKTALKAGGELGLAPTHEEPLTALMTDHVASYKDLPRYVYQFQNKFRNELRAKSGLMRSREFMMKDLYSFSSSDEEFKKFYEECAAAYTRIFKRVGLGDLTFRTFASGGTFSEFSDEFQTISAAGEDIIYIDREKGIAVNQEVYNDETLGKLKLDKNKLEEAKSIEVGNIFPLGTRFSETLGLFYQDEKGEKKPVIMGSYGIGPGRLLGTIAESLSTDKGLVWPASIAPLKVHLILITKDMSGETAKKARELYIDLEKSGVDVLLDDREVSPGEKFADADLIGIPERLVVSDKSLAASGVEIKSHGSEKAEIISFDLVKSKLKNE